MSSILREIVAHKRREVQGRKELYPPRLLEQSIYFSTRSVSLKHYLLRPNQAGVIAEIKRRSPSRGELNSHLSIEELSIGYMQSGASALSVLTDSKYFGGSVQDFTLARSFNFCPVLRKDFIIDEYQLIEAKAIGADVVLLLASVLTPGECVRFSRLAKQLGLEILLEIDDRSHLETHLTDDIDLVGVNNRDLRTLKVNVERSFCLAALVPPQFLKISESGIRQAETVHALKQLGFVGFLVGELFMESSDPVQKCKQFIEGLKQ